MVCVRHHIFAVIGSTKDIRLVEDRFFSKKKSSRRRKKKKNFFKNTHSNFFGIFLVMLGKLGVLLSYFFVKFLSNFCQLHRLTIFDGHKFCQIFVKFLSNFCQIFVNFVDLLYFTVQLFCQLFVNFLSKKLWFPFHTVRRVVTFLSTSVYSIAFFSKVILMSHKKNFFLKQHTLKLFGIFLVMLGKLGVLLSYFLSNFCQIFVNFVDLLYFTVQLFVNFTYFPVIISIFIFFCSVLIQDS